MELKLSCAPIALFVYNRLEHTQRTIQALQQNILAEDSDLIIFSDAAKSDFQAKVVSSVRKYIKEIDGFKSITIIERQENLGLARSIIDGVTGVVNSQGKIIVLEDDMVTSPYFLRYMNDALNLYEVNSDVASVHGYVYPINDLPETFFMRGADCWGWATWKDQWAEFELNGSKLLDELVRRKLTKRFDFNGAYPFTQMLRDQISGTNNSWAIRWHASAFLKNKLTLYPGKSLVLNIGNDGSGTHCGLSDKFSSELGSTNVCVVPVAVEESDQIFGIFERYFRGNQVGILAQLRELIKMISRKVV